MEYYRKVKLATEVEPELIPAEAEEARPQPTPLDFLVDECRDRLVSSLEGRPGASYQFV